MANGWTPERKAKQSQLIRDWKPWEHSTGARTIEGKEIASRNAFKGGFRARLAEISKILKDHKTMLNEVSKVDLY